MNRYPVWIYSLVAVVLIIAALYAVPNLFGEAPAVQVSPARATIKVDSALQTRVDEVLKTANITSTGTFLELQSVKVRFADTETQLKAKDALERGLNSEADNPAYTVALNLLSNSPNWLTAIRALPMYLGLDLRGGVHFLLQVDMKAAQIGRAHV